MTKEQAKSPIDPEEFAKIHGISVTVATAILKNARYDITRAIVAVIKMRG